MEEIGDALVFPRPGRLRVSDDRFQFDFQFPIRFPIRFLLCSRFYFYSRSDSILPFRQGKRAEPSNGRDSKTSKRDIPAVTPTQPVTFESLGGNWQ